MNTNLRLFSFGVALLAFARCTNESNSVPSAPQANVYLQLDREGRPGVKEIFESFADHNSSDRAIPSKDTVLQNDIAGFNPANASANNANLFPDELKLNLAAAGNAKYLSIESGAGGFGGRALSDDAMSLDLNAAYGNQFGGGVVSPCLVTDNVGAPTATTTAGAAFPYLAKPQ